MGTERDFWRLLTDYERLTQNETVSLGSEDFADVETIQACKDALLVKLSLFATEAGLDRRNRELSRRIDLIIEGERANERLVAAMVARATMEKQSLEAARLRLRELGSIYVHEKSGHRSFNALV